MNKYLQKFARDFLKDGLDRLSDENKLVFMRMYSHADLEKPITEVVDNLSEDKLDWAMQQVQNTLDNLCSS